MQKTLSTEELTDLLEVHPQEEMVARFDFPLLGTNETFRVVKVNSRGEIILYNPHVQRPQGHD